MDAGAHRGCGGCQLIENQMLLRSPRDVPGGFCTEFHGGVSRERCGPCSSHFKQQWQSKHAYKEVFYSFESFGLEVLSRSGS
jgi:hypothetical protein